MTTTKPEPTDTQLAAELLLHYFMLETADLSHLQRAVVARHLMADLSELADEAEQLAAERN